MIALTEDVYKLFDNVTEEVSRNVRHLMQQLWLNWSHVGVEYDVKVNNIQKLVQIEKDLHSDVLDETKQKLKVMQHQVTDLNMDRLAKLRQDLQEKYDQTNNRVLELRERLSRLWECLDEDQIYRDNFLQAHPGCTPSTEAAIKEEIKRCEQIKRQKIQVFVANMRTKIKLMWDNIMYSSREREEFLHYYQDIFTEDTLTLHEMYLEKITKFYNEHKNIFDLVVTRKNLWLKQAEMDARASEPGRYHNRGGNLLREEKERKAIETNERHNKLSARKQALTPSNPLLRSLATSPLGKRNRTAAGLAHTAERTRRVSGRLATKALVVKAESNGATVKRKLEYGGDTQKTPKANGSILKHKRTSIGKRRSGGRRSNGARNTVSSENARKNPLMETTKLTSYSDFKVRQCKRNSDELQAFMTSPTPSLIPPNKAVYLEADPFDYEIVNIDYNKLRVRKAEVIDVPQIINLIQTLEGKETMWIVENSIMGKKQHQAYVFMSGVTLVGYGIVEPPEQINFIQAKFNLDYYHIGKYHNRGHGASVGFATLKTTLVYPVIHKANTMAIAMVPLLPRKSESICGLIPQLKNLGVFSRKIAGSPYLTFTNVTLVSPSGLPFIRHCKPHVEMMFLRHRTTTDQFLKSTPYTYYLNVVVGTVVDINKSGNIPPYSRLDDPSYREPQINTYYETPDNVFIVNSLTEANKALRFVKNFYYRNNQVIVYGAYLHAYCCIAALLEMEIPARNITFVEPFPPEDPTKPRIPVFSNIYVDQTMREVLNELGISVYRSYYFQSWNVDMYNMATHVNFLSHFQMVELECSAMFYYGVKGIDANAFQAIHRSGMAYDAGILIDHQFRTNDPSIFAAGPSTRYCPRYFAEFKKQKFYDSYEVGEKGYILETFQGGYFKLHLTADSIVDGITCLSPESYSIGHFKNLYGKSAVVLNNVHIKFAKIDDPLPERVCGRDMVVAKETYRTTTGEYCVKPNPNKAMERADCSINCRRVIFMTGVEKRLQGKTITQPTMISETKDTYRGIAKSPLMPPAVTVRGFGPRHKEIWMPLTAKVHRAVYDRIHVKKECHEVAAVFQSETKKKFQVPFALSPLASWSHGEVFDLAPFPPNPYQTNIAPFMYCSDYCHISQGTPPYTCGKVYPDNTEKCGRSMVQGVDYKGLGAHPWVARIGFTREYDTTRGSDCNELFCAPPTQAIKVENVVVHVGYEQKIFRHDIALIVLKDEMKYSVSVAPICLNDKPEIVINERALLVGWGKLSGQNNLPSQFKKASEDSKVWAKMYYLYFKPISNIISCSPNTQYKEQWLLTKGKMSAVVKNIENAAKLNKLEIKENLSMLSCEKNASSNFVAVIVETLKSKSLLKRFFICIIWWNTCTFVDHGLTLNSVLLKGNKYFNYGLVASLACQEWKRTLVGTAHAAGYMLGIFFVGSLSDRWLLTKGKKNTVVMNIENAAKLNKIEIKENLSTLSYEKETSSNFMAVIAKTFKSKSLLKRFFVCIIWWNTCTFVDHGLLINSVLLKGNRYVNYGVISFKWFNIAYIPNTVKKPQAIPLDVVCFKTDEKEKEAENNYFNLKLFLYQTLYVSKMTGEETNKHKGLFTQNKLSYLHWLGKQRAEEKKKKYKKDYGDDEKQVVISLSCSFIKGVYIIMFSNLDHEVNIFSFLFLVNMHIFSTYKSHNMTSHPNSIDKQLGSQHQQMRYQTTPYPVQATVEAFCIMSMQVMKEVMDYMMVSTTTDLTMVMATNMSMVMNIMISIITIQAITVMATSAITIIWGTDIIISITIFITSKAMTDDQKAIIRQHFEQLSMECIKDNPITSDDIASLKAKKMDESGMLQKETILQKAKAMTMKQIRNTGKMIRKSCQPKNNVEDEKIDPIKDGVFIEEKEVMCYMACVMKMANTMDGKGMFDVAGAEAMVEKTHGDDTTMIENSKKLFDVCKSDGIQDIKEDIIMLHIAS
ncbi:hypothetical protein MSG28_004620 [Choristoneura fumiferana]|uniref:Uncharacterized protein n=1 Tax=Choristoneura fumiferana TaxID=7141 RepID=A0ACC0K7E7_CHOFU|nr:hypothetical protein MSG28_004620 [Choristoneura fumiferana]